MITITNLCKNFGDVKAVNNLSLTIKDKEIFALLGLNGAGKSTCIKILSGLLHKTSGTVEINGLNIDKNAKAIKQIINVSPQETAIANNLTVKENLIFIAGLYGIKINNKIDEILKKFDLVDKKNKRAKTLSGGQKRKLSIAMALISEPKILILDEPTLALDVKARRTLWNIISSYKNKITIILTTHYLEEAEALSNHIAIMSKGTLSASGTKEEIIKMADAQNFEEAFLKFAGGDDE